VPPSEGEDEKKGGERGGVCERERERERVCVCVFCMCASVRVREEKCVYDSVYACRYMCV